ncbi:8-amino-3,8-dideoxy-alpha-D-manno-octulosonate transaminase [Saccharicrinis carchari]|uniref:8-amino-3,8-dideoxy-alpha-D-manno-octulosonate transaminase n=1 Tax=Saccharicrinis carchari TaxID=1168039 RepID=A0A521DF09_SACCC|nr:DegT/DnrJ/EryC1/StrS family aminotransferase [Saccharicrinis carchari]SMO70253.1 8-amino-3,8-dideoxy-alpha-D-manno-octulosonate transaminase [Saccharicrinis carchari]
MPGTEIFGKEEKEQVMEVLDKGVLFRYNHDKERNGIWKAKDFEKEFAEYHGAKHCHMVASGTAADCLSLAAVGVGAGDEVIVPPFTFIAPIEAVVNCGAVPVFAEVDETLCMTAESIEAVITPKTKAVLLVHMVGAMAQIDEIVEVCKKHNIILIEDAAQSLGGSYKGKMLGTFGKIGCFSFDFFKLVTAGEGGAIITNDDDVYETAHTYSDHGHSHQGDNRGAEEHAILGTNYRISELHAAVGLAQFRKLDYMLERLRANKKVLKDYLKKFPQITFRPLPDEDGDSATVLNFFLPTQKEAESVAAALAADGVASAYWYNNNYHFIKNWDHLKECRVAAPVGMQFLDKPQDYKTLELPQSYDIIGRLVSINMKITTSPEELQTICKTFDKVLG